MERAPARFSEQRGTLEEKVRLLSRVDVFEGLSGEELRDLVRRSNDLALEKNRTWPAPVHRGGLLYVILSGKVRLYEAVKEREFTFLVAEGGTFFGEMSLSEQPIRSIYAQALEPSWLCVMNRRVLEYVIKNRPEVGIRMMELLTERLSFYVNRLVDIGVKEVRPRLASFILHLAEIEGLVSGDNGIKVIKIPTHYTHQQLGTMIGANREAVTVAFTELRNTGTLDLVQRHIHIKDIEALKQLAS